MPVTGPLRCCLILAAIACGAARGAAAQDVAYTGGTQVATGRYLFEERTSSVYVFSGIDVTAGPVHLAASVPLIVQTTPWVTYGPVPLPSGGRRAGEVARQGRRGQRRIVLPAADVSTSTGIGDPLLRGDVELVAAGPNRPSIRIGVGAKLPIAGVEDGFGTGEWDVGAGLTLSKQSGVHSIVADVSFWRFGDLDDLPLKDAWSYGAGYARSLGRGRWSLLVSASGFTTVIEGRDPPVQLGIGLGRLFPSRRAVNAVVAFGLTETAPDLSVGLGWRIGL